MLYVITCGDEFSDVTACTLGAVTNMRSVTACALYMRFFVCILVRVPSVITKPLILALHLFNHFCYP